MPDDARPPDVEAQAPAAQAPIDQYTLPDSAYDPDLDAPVEAAPPEARAAPPHGPDGKFTSPTPQHSHPKTLLALAADLRFSQERIDSYSPEQLDLAVASAYEQKQLLQAEFARDRAAWERQYGGAPRKEEPPPEPDYPFDFGKHEDGKPVSESDLHPAVLSPLKQLAKEVTALKARLSDYERRDRSRAEEEGFSQLDQGFADLGPQYEHVYGKGRGNDMAADDPCLLLRAAVVNSLRVKPIPGLSVAAAVKKRGAEVASRFKPPAPEPSEVHRRWDESGLARPTARGKEKLPKGDKAAYKAVGKQMREDPQYQSLLDEYEGDEMNGIPE